MNQIDYGLLRETLGSALNCYIKAIQSQTPLENIYAVGLYTDGELTYLTPTANSNYKDVPPAIRWSPADWGHHLLTSECFQNVEKELLKGWNNDFSEFSVDREKVLNVCTYTLTDLRDTYFKGSKTVVGIFEGGNMASSVVINSIRKINPPEVARAFEDTLHLS